MIVAVMRIMCLRSGNAVFYWKLVLFSFMGPRHLLKVDMSAGYRTFVRALSRNQSELL